MSPLEAAMDLIRVYVERGDDFDQFRGGYLGCYSTDYGASVGGYLERKQYPNTKILVIRVGKKEVNEVFSLRMVWDMILAEKTQPKLL